MNRFFSHLALIALASFGLAHAQSWPNKTVRLVVPFPAGGATDLIARAIAAAGVAEHRAAARGGQQARRRRHHRLRRGRQGAPPTATRCC